MGLIDAAINILTKSKSSNSSSTVEQVQKIFDTKFSQSSNFLVSEFTNFVMLEEISNNVVLDNIKHSLLEFSISDIQHSPIEEWINNTWVFTTGKPNLNKITFTFRDFNGSTLYSYFKLAWWKLKDKLPDDQKWNIKVYSINDYTLFKNGTGKVALNSSLSPKDGSVVLYTTDALLTSVGPLQLSKSNPNGFVTFSVTFTYFLNDPR